MHYNRLFSEFLHNPMIAMEGRRFNAAFSLIMQNLHEGVEIDFGDKTLGSLVSAGGMVTDYVSAEDFCQAIDTNSYHVAAGQNGEGGGSTDEEPQTFISVMRIEGPMSREGDECTYGSKDHNRMMKRAANDANCRGHVLLINSGGGASRTLPDYRDAINYCLAKGQNVVAVVDECAASAACFTANMTSRIFAMRDTDEVGSLGMFATFTTIADGTKIPQTNEIVHIRYAEQSPDKNYEWREAAKGNLKPIDDMLKADLAQVLADTQQDRPSLLDEQLTGKMYPASEVMGSMVDEIGGLQEAINWLMADYDARNGAPLAAKQTAPKPAAPAKSAAQATVPEASASGTHTQETATPNTNPNTQSKMYENIASALGLEEIAHSEDGVMLNTPLADQLEAHLQAHSDALAAKDKAMADALAAKEQEMTDALAAKDAEIAALTAAAETAATEHQTALTNAETAHQQAIDALNAEHQQAIDTLNAEHTAAIEANATALSEKKTALTTAQQQLDEANATIQNLEQKVTTLQTEAPAPSAGAAPADNGSEMPQAQTLAQSVYQWDNSKSVAENMAAKSAFEAANRAQ